MVHFVVRWRVFTLPAVAILALLGLYGASRVEEGFEIKDFFSSDTDLVKGLDKNELYFGPGGGDLDYVYVEGDLTAPDTLVAIEATEATISESDALLVRDFNGDVEFSPNAATVVRLATSSAIMRDAIAAQSGVEITDDDGDGLADTAEQVAAIYEYVRTEAIDDDDGVEVFTPDRTETFLFVGDSVQATRVAFGIATFTDKAIISMVPILLVVAWIYGFMFVVGYKINVITATIAAISVGVGVDYATHFTMRFIEEFEHEPSRFPALRRAGEGTGGALAISAVTSMTGFLVMAMAPMPMFETFGVLTAVMIFFSLLVSLLVLPSLLILVTPSRKGEEREQMIDEATHGGEFDYEPHSRETAVRGGAD